MRQVVDARAGDHPISLSNNLLQSACPLALFVGDLTLAERYIRALMEFSVRYAAQFTNVGGAGPSVYPPPVQCFRGILLVKRGDVGAGLKLLSTASTLVPQNAFSIIYTLFLFEIAGALGRDGNATEGLSAINEALARSERNEERW